MALRVRRERTSDPYMVEQRWYYVQAVPVAYAQQYREGYYRDGDYLLFLGSHVGNSGQWFRTDADLLAFLVSELTRAPL